MQPSTGIVKMRQQLVVKILSITLLGRNCPSNMKGKNPMRTVVSGLLCSAGDPAQGSAHTRKMYHPGPQPEPELPISIATDAESFISLTEDITVSDEGE